MPKNKLGEQLEPAKDTKEVDLGSLKIQGEPVKIDFHGTKAVNGVVYHDIHCVDGTTYLLNDADLKNWKV